MNQSSVSTSMDAINSDPVRRDFRGPPSITAALDFERILSSFRRHLRLFIVVTLLVIAAVAFVTLSSAPRYTADATVLIHEHTPDVLHLNAITPQDSQAQTLGTDSSAVDTEVEILKSRSLASRVVDQLHLDADPEFNGALRPPGRLASLKKSLMGAPNVDPAAAKQQQYEGVVSTVLSNLLVKRTGTTYTIDVGFTSFSPAKAALIANAFAQRYLTEALDAKIDDSTNATSWLNTRLDQLKKDVEAADNAVAQYKIQNNLMSAAGSTLTEQEISNIDTQLATARAADAEQDARLKTAERQLAAGSNGGDIGEVLNNSVIGSLRAQRAQASAQLADLQARYGDKHPDILKARRALADIDIQIQGEIQRVISNLKAQSEIAHTRTASLAASAGQTRNTLAGNNQALVRLDELQRNDDAVRAIYEGFLARYKEANAKDGIQQPDARIVSQAKQPTAPSAPNKKLDMFLALVLGLVAGTGAIILSEMLERGVSSVADIENAFSLPALGEIPTLASTLDGRLGRRRLDPVAYVVAKPLSRFAESFRNLRTTLLASRTGTPVKVIAITSSLPGEGKTTTALCLARTVAMSGSKVVIVDCDLRQRSINRALAVEPTAGLMEVLSGTTPLQQALIQDNETSAWILPLTKAAFTPRDVFGSEAMERLLDVLRSEFDVVILDTAPVLAVADTRVLSPRADVVLFLTKWRKTSRHAVLAALRGLNSPGTFVAGVALTQVNIREQARSGEGAGHYYRAYRKYYSG
ncbi:MAG: GumC family protein [Caulobacteraceae bacterium]